jgi:hypothetical protein
MLAMGLQIMSIWVLILVWRGGETGLLHFVLLSERLLGWVEGWGLHGLMSMEPDSGLIIASLGLRV